MKKRKRADDSSKNDRGKVQRRDQLTRPEAPPTRRDSGLGYDTSDRDPEEEGSAGKRPL